MTRATWRVRTAAGHQLLLQTDAMEPGKVTVLMLPNATDAYASDVTSTSLKPWQNVSVDEVRVVTRMLTVVVETPTWVVEVTSRPIYGLVPPLANETHVHGHWAVDQRRFDVTINGAFPQPDAHGIVGQSYQDDAVRNGKLDDYDIESADKSAQVNSDGYLPSMTTSAQAEGAIDGLFTDYVLQRPASTAFAYSRFDRTAKSPRDSLWRTASTREWDGQEDLAERNRQLQAHRHGRALQSTSSACTACTTTSMRWASATTSWTLTNGDLTAAISGSGDFGSVYGTVTKVWGSGKWYMEVALEDVSSMFGIASTDSSYVHSVMWYYEASASGSRSLCVDSCLSWGPIYGANTFNSGDVGGIALDLSDDVGRPYAYGAVRFYVNGIAQPWIPLNNAAAGTSGVSLVSGAWTIAAADHSGNTNSNQLRILSNPTYDPPPGYSWIT
jgi:hypothetical protein